MGWVGLYCVFHSAEAEGISPELLLLLEGKRFLIFVKGQRAASRTVSFEFVRCRRDDVSYLEVKAPPQYNKKRETQQPSKESNRVEKNIKPNDDNQLNLARFTFRFPI